MHKGSVYSAPSQTISIDLGKGTTSATLECPLGDDGFAQWYRGDTRAEVLPEDGRYSFPDMKTLSVMKLTEGDDGLTFECGTFLGEVKKIFKLSMTTGRSLYNIPV